MQSRSIRLLCKKGIIIIYRDQGFVYRPDRPNRRGPVPVYRSVPVEFKFEFKKLSSTGSYRYTGRLDRFTSRFDRFTGRFDRFEFKSKFKIACVTGIPAD